MSVREARDRRGRAVRGDEGLLERGQSLRAIDALLTATQGGRGGALLIEGHAGMGKTRLHEAALDRARAAGFSVLRAAGAELEQDMAHGVAIKLLTRLLDELEDEGREQLLADVPERARVLAGRSPASAELTGDDLSTSHAIFTVLATSSETRPTLVAIDDLHWCDAASLEFVLYLLHRLDELPLALVLGQRPDLGDGPSEVLDRIATHPAVTLDRLAPLGREAVGEVAGRQLGDRDDEAVIEACFSATAGNPFYLHELLLALREEPDLPRAALARRAQGLAPDAVARAVRVRVGRLGSDAGALARAVAILGDEVPLRRAAALAGMRMSDAAAAADRLASVEILLAREPLRYVHPLVSLAIAEDIPASQRASRHLDAARLLYAEGEGAERVAAHLLRGRAEGNQWVVERLRAAAHEARIRGAAASAVSYLERALSEPPQGELRGEVLAELGAAEAMVGSPQAAAHLSDAARVLEDPRRGSELRLQQGHALHARGRHREAATAYEAGIALIGGDAAQPTDPEMSELRSRLQTGYVATAMLTPELGSDAARRSAALLSQVGGRPRSPGERMLLSQAAIQRSFAGDPAKRVAELAEWAWDDGRLLEHETCEGVAWTMVTAALTLSGRLERSLEVTDAVLEDARRRSSPLAEATADYCRGLPTLGQGRVIDAMACLERALDATRFGWCQFSRGARATYALCLIERGDFERAAQQLDEADAIATSSDLETTFCLSARAELALAQGRAEEALGHARAVGASIPAEVKELGNCQWRLVGALAAFAAGDRRLASALAEEANEISARTEVLHNRIRSLRVLGLLAGGVEGIRLLERAVELGSSVSTPRLETIRALVDLGAARRRGNQRASAREPLQRAADLARAGGAKLLHERARTELAAAGARPRRDWLQTGAESLTASERRIAELAASGESNRQIAQTLFVTPKTVEYHLRNAYRKLNVSGRGDLADALDS